VRIQFADSIAGHVDFGRLLDPSLSRDLDEFFPGGRAWIGGTSSGERDIRSARSCFALLVERSGEGLGTNLISRRQPTA